MTLGIEVVWWKLYKSNKEVEYKIFVCKNSNLWTCYYLHFGVIGVVEGVLGSGDTGLIGVLLLFRGDWRYVLCEAGDGKPLDDAAVFIWALVLVTGMAVCACVCVSVWVYCSHLAAVILYLSLEERRCSLGAYLPHQTCVWPLQLWLILSYAFWTEL